MQDQEYKARDKTVRKMNRDGLTEENLYNGETVRVSHREREERILPKQAEDVSFFRQEKEPEQPSEGRKQRQKLKNQTEAGRPVDISPHAAGRENVESGDLAGTNPAILPSSVTGNPAEPGQTEPAGEDNPASAAHNSIREQSFRSGNIRGHPSDASAFLESASETSHLRKKKLVQAYARKERGKPEDAAAMEDFREEIKGKTKRGQIQKEQKNAGRLSFGDEGNGMVRGAGMGISKKAVSAAAGSAAVYVHGKTHEAEQENTAVEGVHRAELMTESALRYAMHRTSRGLHKRNVRLQEAGSLERGTRSLLYETAQEGGEKTAQSVKSAEKLVAEDLEHGFDDGAMEAVTEYLYEKVPEPFIKWFYVVNDAYGDKAEQEYQYFEKLDEAIQTYHLLPNHLDKRLGMESREPVTSRMPLISCKNGIEKVEDIETASLNGKWVNPEVADTVNQAAFYLDNRGLEVAYSLVGMNQYFFIQSTDGGYDYTFYDADYREIDGGIYENEDVSEQEVIEDILSGEAGGKPVTYKVMDVEELLEQTQKAAIEQMEPSISFYAAECMEFPVMGEYHDNLTLAEAFEKYQAIPAERMNGIKGIGFRLEDGSIYDGDYELMRAGSISKDAIDLVPHYKESSLVQKAMADLEKMLAEEQQRIEPVQTEPAAEPGGQDRPGNTVQKPEAAKPAGVRQSVFAALRERQAKQKAQEQQVQKEGEKTEKIAQGRRKGEPEL